MSQYSVICQLCLLLFFGQKLSYMESGAGIFGKTWLKLCRDLAKKKKSFIYRIFFFSL